MKTIKFRNLDVIMISPLYQAIRDFDTSTIPSGAGDANYLAPLYDQILIHFSKLLELYQAHEEEK